MFYIPECYQKEQHSQEKNVKSSLKIPDNDDTSPTMVQTTLTDEGMT